VQNDLRPSTNISHSAVM